MCMDQVSRDVAPWTARRRSIFHVLLLSSFLVFFLLKPYFSNYSCPLYLVDFSCLRPPSSCRVPFSKFLGNASKFESFNSGSIAFMAKHLTSSGQSEETYLPPALHFIPPKTQLQESIKEVHMVLFTIMDDLLAKTKLSPRDIDILIVNCSGFCPSPSLSSIVINKYAMRSDIKSFNLSGMGCSASALSINLGQNLLKVHKNSYAIVLSTEILSNGWYAGNERPKLLLNCLFRMGSAAVLLTNKKEARKSSKYELFHTLRTQRAFDDKAYLSAIREEDSTGRLGVTLKRDLLHVAGETLRSNVTLLGSSILPFLEKLWHGLSIIRKRFMDKSAEIYVPNFKTVIQHFCLPTSGRPVIKEIAKGLKLGDREMEPALMTLHRFGNQSSSSLWYELAYLEAQDRVRKGDKVWQIGMGSGPKCVSVIWKCIRPIAKDQNSPWADCVHQYPIVPMDPGV
ncbi:hypothetical protein FNV43_RR24187 [Rhamnella rubrinervis]|uniref:3-ketoacyl-CoA synthase n=1 Tax=Rhamnella rubrinervis TaxID=2594499 RepID=A0A8K0DL95_9ROSA|nr:hypothetical protein FNV43_RR24187 [Rhamnella rubrinervis]